MLLSLLLIMAVLVYYHYEMKRKVSSLEQELEAVHKDRRGIAGEVDHLKDRLKRAMWQKEDCMEKKRALSHKLHNIQKTMVGA